MVNPHLPMRFFIYGPGLTEKLLGPVRTAAKYRLYPAENGRHPRMCEVQNGGVSIAGELYDLSPGEITDLIAAEPPDAYQCTIELEDGSTAEAMLYPRDSIEQPAERDAVKPEGWADRLADMS